MTPMVSTAAHKYGGKSYKTGDKFMAEDAHVAVLEHVNFAKRDLDAPQSNSYSTRVINPASPGTPKSQASTGRSSRADMAPSATKGRQQRRPRQPRTGG